MDKRPNNFSMPPIDNLHLLALASLFEGNFSIDWLVELSGKKASYILSQIAGAIKEKHLTNIGPGVFCFKDLEKRQSWQDSLAMEEKAQLHQRIADILLMELPEDERKPQTVAYHLIHTANDFEKCRYLMKGGDSFRKTYHIEEALRCYTKVLGDISTCSGEEADSVFMEAAIKYSKISTARHDTTKVLFILEEAMARAKRWDRQSYQALLKMHLAKNEWLCSQYHTALRHFKQAWSMTKGLGDPNLLRSATTFSTFFLYWQGRFREAVRDYEKSVPDIQKVPTGEFPLLATLTVGHCYVLIGQITQGLGMMHAIRNQCRETGNRYLESLAGVMIGATLFNINRLDDALQFLESSLQDATQAYNDWAQILARLMLAFCYFLKGEKQRAVDHLHEFLQHTQQVQVTVQAYPYLMELCWAMERKKLPQLPGISLRKEIDRMIRGMNVFTKGVAYRYRALLQKREGLGPEPIIKTLSLSLRWLEESGHQIELARTQQELARQYSAIGEEEKAREMTLIASKIPSSFLNEELVPEDLKPMIQESPPGGSFLHEIFKLGQELVTIRNNQDLVQQIISVINRITGAERGAIFLLGGDIHFPMLQLRASRNLTSSDIHHESFASSMKMIEEVSLTGKGRILNTGSTGNPDSLPGEIIRSRICVPMILREKVVGVLYHDNRILSSAFKESDLELLSYFAAQAALAMDNACAYDEIRRLNQKLKEEKQYYEEQHLQSIHFEEIVGESPAIIDVLAKVEQVANCDATVLILGETGVGKELVARAIHRHSTRRDQPFILVQCSIFPDSLIPSELFGHEKGAFTGAIKRRIGRFELADKGTLFLDEIGDLSPEVQVRLLRVLQTKEFERVGGSETLRSDFRLVAATNHNLEEEVKAQRFRSDLFYRINVFPIYVPPLRERKEDIPLLAHYFMRIYAGKMGKSFDVIPKAEMDRLFQYDWPGNIRELENIIERGVILSSESYFRIPKLGVEHFESPVKGSDMTLQENERRHILWGLQKTGWKVRGLNGAAELLQIHPSTLEFRMKKLGIKRPQTSSL